MNEYQVTTAQNVTLSFNYASIGNRIAASIIDYFIIVGYVLAVTFAYFYFAKNSFDHSWIIMAIMLLPVAFYSLLFEFFTHGRTPGKRIMKIRVAPIEGDQLSFGRCLIRWLFRLIDMNMSSGMIAVVAVATSARKQRIGDMLAGTLVLSDSDAQTIEQTIYSYVNNDRQVHYVDVTLLKPRDIEVIKEVLRQYTQNDKYDLVTMTAQKVRTAINAPRDLEDAAFLKAVVEDYYISGEKL